MEKKILPLIACLLITMGASAQDQCSSAIAITAGTYTVSAVNGSGVPTPVCTGGAAAAHGEWYTYTPGEDYSLTVTTDLASNAGGDTRFHIYTGTCGSLTCVGGDDDSGTGYLSVTSLNVTQGVTYIIAFDDNWSASGFQFQLMETPPASSPLSFTPILTLGNYSMCVVDMNGDHLDDVVITGTNNVQIYHQQIGGGFVQANVPTPQADNPASWSLAAGDIDDNGYTDLMYGGGSGATFMMAGAGGTSFSEVSFPQYIFCQRTNMVDIDADGDLDAFSCHDVDANVYFTNDGLGNLSFHQGGFGPTCGNYGSIWVDYDNDHDVDCFIAKCGCDPIDQLHQNQGGLVYTNVATGADFADGHQSWSSAWGDFDNDGDMDVLVGSSSSSYHKLMRNDGGTFTNVTVGSGLDTFGGQSIEWVTHDFNNDGFLDILGGGGFLLGNGDLTFTSSPITPGNGPIGDLNNDGFLDIVSGSTVYANDGNSNHWLTVNTTGTVSNLDGIGARVEVSSPSFTQIRDVRSGDGFKYMSSLNTHFGLGTDAVIDEVTVYWPSGIVQVVSAPPVDGALEIVEGVNTVITDPTPTSGLSIYPNPAEDVLYVTADQDLNGSVVRIIDVTGKQMMATTLQFGQLDISGMTSGMYLLQVEDDGRILQQRFTIK